MNPYTAAVFADVPNEGRVQIGWATPEHEGVRDINLFIEDPNFEYKDVTFVDNYDAKATEEVPREELALDEGKSTNKR